MSLQIGAEPGTMATIFLMMKVFDADGHFTHTRIILKPLNPDFDPIVIKQADDDHLRVLGEFVGRIVGRTRKWGQEDDPIASFAFFRSFRRPLSTGTGSNRVAQFLAASR
jgi:hypothetical protein